MKRYVVGGVLVLGLCGCADLAGGGSEDGGGGASECEVVCDKLVECVPEGDRETCITSCDEAGETDPGCVSACADCYGGAECDALLAGEACTTECACDSPE